MVNDRNFITKYSTHYVRGHCNKRPFFKIICSGGRIEVHFRLYLLRTFYGKANAKIYTGRQTNIFKFFQPMSRTAPGEHK